MLREIIRKNINAMLAKIDFKLTDLGDRAFEDYIPFSKTINAANAKGMALGEYIDWKYNVPGETEKTIEKMEEIGVFRNNIQRVCEIGPGSGRYLEKVLRRCQPEIYEIYEPAEEWKRYLVERYKVKATMCDGKSLSATPDYMVNLLHSHKVFPGLPILTILGYFYEMARVTKENAWLVFDLITERCLDDITIKKWLNSGIRYLSTMIPKQFVIDFFEKQGFTLHGSFLINMKPGFTEYLVFKRGILPKKESGVIAVT